MLDRSEEIPDRATDPLGRRVGSDEQGVLFLETDQLTQQSVVLHVRDLGLVEDVVSIAVITKLLAQLLDALLDPLRYRLACHDPASRRHRRPDAQPQVRRPDRRRAGFGIRGPVWCRFHRAPS